MSFLSIHILIAEIKSDAPTIPSNIGTLLLFIVCPVGLCLVFHPAEYNTVVLKPDLV